MRKLSKHLQMLFVFLFLILIIPQKADAATISGGGTKDNPYVLTGAAGTTFNEVVNKTASDNAVYCKVIVQPGTKMYFSTGSSSFIYSYPSGFYGSYNRTSLSYEYQYNSSGANTYYFKVNTSSNVKLEYTVTAMDGMVTNTTKETAIDITNGYTSPTTTTLPYRSPVWYKFKLSKSAVFTFDFSRNGNVSADSSNAFAIIDPSGRNIARDLGGTINNESYPGSFEGEAVKFNSIVNHWSDSKTLTLYDPGTYYFVICPSFYKDYTKHYAFKASFRNYIPISKATFAKTTFTLYEKGSALGQEISDRITITPSNADGRIASYKASNSAIFSKKSNGTINPFKTNGKMGSSTVTAYDERGKKVGSFKVNVLPKKIGNNIQLVGSPTGMKWRIDEVETTILDDVDYFRIYIKSGSKYKLKKTYTVNSSLMKHADGFSSNYYELNITGLKANTAYSLAVTQLVKENGKLYESPKKYMKVKTAITKKPTFTTKVTYKWRNYRYTAFPNSIFQYYYWKKQYCADVTVSVSKVAGISGYEIYYGTWPYASVKASKRTSTYNVAHADSKSQLKKTCSIWVRTYNEFKYDGTTGRSYGPWVKKTVKIR